MDPTGRNTSRNFDATSSSSSAPPPNAPQTGQNARIQEVTSNLFQGLPIELKIEVLNRITCVKDLVNYAALVNLPSYRRAYYVDPRLVSALYRRILNHPDLVPDNIARNQNQLKSLKAQKKQILEFIQQVGSDPAFTSLNFSFPNATANDLKNIKAWAPHLTHLNLAHCGSPKHVMLVGDYNHI